MKKDLTLLLLAVGLWAQPPGGGGAQSDGIWRRNAVRGEGPVSTHALAINLRAANTTTTPTRSASA